MKRIRKSQSKSQAKGAYKDERPGPAWRAAERAGIDMSLIEINLSKSVAERIRAHASALRLVEQLRTAMERTRVRP